jgi:putative MATE family efflux protein
MSPHLTLPRDVAPTSLSVKGLIKQALAGTQISYAAYSLNQTIALLAIPMMLEMALESAFGITDIFWVSKLGPNAIAAVGLTESLLTIIFAISSGLSTAATAMVARRIGEGDRDKAAIDAVQAIALSVAIGIVLGVPLYFAGPRLLMLMGATAPVMKIGASYAKIALGTSGVIVLLSLNNAIFRGSGDAAFAMRLLWIANIINLVLDPLLIFGLGPFPRLGVTAPAVATLIGRGCAVGYQLYRLARGSERLRIEAKHLRLNLAEMWAFIKISLGGMVQFVLEQGRWLALVRIVSIFGATAIAGYTVAFRLLGFLLLPTFGLSNAAATLVGQSLGANDAERARKSIWRTGLVNLAFLGGLSVIFILAAHPLISLFINDSEATATAIRALRIFCFGNFFFAFAAIFLQAFNGAGDTFTPTILNFVIFWIIEIPLAWGLATKTDLKIGGVFVAILVAQALALLLSGGLFMRGHWQKARV